MCRLYIKFLHTQEGMTALLYAASKGHTSCVRGLVIGGADKEAKNNVRAFQIKVL
jgi:hypothetical protein